MDKYTSELRADELGIGPLNLAGRLDRQSWPADLAGRLVKIKD
jgi:hypothetical protein